MPCDYRNYPKNWKTKIRPDIVARAGNCCEGSPKYPNCRAPNYEPHPVTGSRVVLTIAHRDHDTNNNDYDNLVAWCQCCHNTYDAPHRAETRRKKSAQLDFFKLLEVA